MDDYVREFVDETEESITRLNNLLLDLERSPDDEAVLQEIFRTAHTLKGNAGAMGLDRASDLSHAMEDLLDAIRAGDIEVTPDLMDTLFAAVDCLETMVDELAVAGAIRTDPAETIAALRAPLSDETVDVAPPPDDELAAILSGFSPPSNPEHDAFLVRMAIADSAELNNGLVVVEALIDAFDLIGTDPSRTAIENEEFGNRIDAVFGTAVGEAAISAALEPVDAVEAFSILTVTDRIEETTEDSDGFSPIDEDLSADISSDEANEMSVDDLLDEFAELDDIDALAEQVEDVSEFENIGDAGSFDDIIAGSSGDAEPTDEPTEGADESADSSDESESVEDAGAVFEELKQEVDMVGFDELQDELAELEFEEFDEEEIGMDELLGDDVDVDDPAFLDVEESEPGAGPIAEEVSREPTDDAPATEADSPAWSADAAGDLDAATAAEASAEGDSEPSSEPTGPSSASAAAPDADVGAETAGSDDDTGEVYAASDQPADATERPGEPEPAEETDEEIGRAAEPDETRGPATSPDDGQSAGSEPDPATESSAFADELFSGGDAASAGTDDSAGPVSAGDDSDAEPDGSVAESDGPAPADADTPSIDDPAEIPNDTAADVEAAATSDAPESTADDDSAAGTTGPHEEGHSGDVDSDDVAADDTDTEPAAAEAVDEADVADDEEGVADDEGSETSVAFDLDRAADAPGEGSASEPDDGTEPTVTDASSEPASSSAPSDAGRAPEPVEEPLESEPTPDSPSPDESRTEPVTGDGVEAESGPGVEIDDDAPADATEASATGGSAAGEADGPPTDTTNDTSADAVEPETADDTDGVSDRVDSDSTAEATAPEESSVDRTETDDSDDEGAFGGEADAFDISSGLDDLGTEFEEDVSAVDSFAEEGDDGSAWDGSDEPVDVDDVADFDSGLTFEDDPAAGPDDAFGTDDGFDVEDDFDSGMQTSADGIAGDATFEGEDTAVDTSGTDFDESAEDDSTSTDDVLAELPEMEIPDIDIPTTAEFDTDTDFEEHAQSVRVDREQVDSLLQLVEGLVTSRVRLRTAVDAREPYEAIERELEELGDFTTELQETVMDVRLVPLQTVTNRLPRVVRDLAREQDKQVTFDQSAADVELDRGILDEIGDPLIHLVRNAVDHGIEDTDTRAEAGKPPEGTIELRADRTQNRVRIEISDDGSGLDPDRLRDAAVEADILSRAEADDLSDQEAYDLVFHSGLSTADQVTDVSGRGVGMDVVRRTIDELNGTVSIDSTPGEGTTVSMTLPVSVAVDDVLFVESGGEQFGIPVDVVREISDGAHVTETDEELVFDRGEETLPIIELGEALETGESRTQDPDGMVVRIRDDVRDVGLKCDVVHARREVVVNPFEGFMRNIPGVSGATVRGRGEVITILDVSTI